MLLPIDLCSFLPYITLITRPQRSNPHARESGQPPKGKTMIQIIYGKMTKKGEQSVRGIWVRPGNQGPTWEQMEGARYALNAPDGVAVGQDDIDAAIAIEASAKAAKCRFWSASAVLGHLNNTKDIGLSRKDHAFLVREHQKGFASRWSASPSLEEEIDEMTSVELVTEAPCFA